MKKILIIPSESSVMIEKAIASTLVGVVIGFGGLARAAKMPPLLQECASEPVKYVGDVFCDKRYYDGRLRHVVGAHNYQAFSLDIS